VSLERERALVAELADTLRERVRPALGSHAGRAHADESDGAAGA
jgi:Fe-S cluster biogenesis protein NfuA